MEISDDDDALRATADPYTSPDDAACPNTADLAAADRPLPLPSSVQIGAPVSGTSQMDLDSSDGEADGAAQCLHMPERDLFVPQQSFSASLEVIGAFEPSQHTLGSFGTYLKRLICSTPTSLGKLCHIFSSIAPRSFLESQTGSAPEGRLDLFPLPYAAWSAEDMKSLYSRHNAAQFFSYAELWDNPNAADRLSNVLDWIWCLTVALNYMYVDFGKDSISDLSNLARLHSPSDAQMEAISRLYLNVDEFIGDGSKAFTVRDWKTIIQSRTLSYDGEVVARAQILTLDQVLASLPPVGVAGSIDILELVPPKLQMLLQDPENVLLPRGDWPKRFSKAKMHIKPSDWPQLARELLDRNICKPLPKTELIYHNGEPLLNGIFGVGKNKFIKDRNGNEVEVQRLIINLVPSNEIQVDIVADVATLPHFAQWSGVELLDDETLIWASEDISCAFYIFQLPESWLPYFTLDWPVRACDVGMAGEDEFHLAFCSLPMGWKSAVGICQCALRSFVNRPELGSGLPPQAELRKDRSLPISFCDSDFRVRQWYQCYIDNWDGASIEQRDGPSAAAACKASPSADSPAGVLIATWQKMVHRGYLQSNVPRAPDKSTLGPEGQTLGVAIDGKRGAVCLGFDKLSDMICLTMFILSQGVQSSKSLAMLVGRLIFMFQLRRPCMVMLQHVFQVINRQVAVPQRLSACCDELLTCLCLLPVCFLDWRLPLDSLVTCSDASETGAGVCMSKSLSRLGEERLGCAIRTTGAMRTLPVGLVELFGGIGGGRRALEILGITPEFHVHFETNEEANRVVQTQYPDARCLGSIDNATFQMFDTLARSFVQTKYIIVTAGPPCQDVSGLNAGRAGFSGSRSSLAMYVPRIHAHLRDAFPNVVLITLMEMVASLTEKDQRSYDTLNGGKPYRICSSDITYVNRPRLYWTNFELMNSGDYDVQSTGRFHKVKLRSRRKPPISHWMPKGWSLTSATPRFPTFVRAIRREKPPYRPAGIETCDEATLNRWKAAKYIYPPYQFTIHNLVVNNHKQLVPPNSEIRERLMGYEVGHTFNCQKTSARKGDPQAWELARCSLIGNSFHCNVVAWLLGHGLGSHQVLARPPMVEAVADIGMPHHFGAADENACRYIDDPKETRELALVRHYGSLSSHRGADVALASAAASAKLVQIKGINPLEWEWEDVLATKWRLHGEHINVYEMRAYLLALRWRTRHSRCIGSKFLHLVDSRVSLGVFAKGRTTSWMLRKVLTKINAVCLAGSLSPLLGYCRSHLNPADAPSRLATPQASRAAADAVDDTGIHEISRAATDADVSDAEEDRYSVPRARRVLIAQ